LSKIFEVQFWAQCDFERIFRGWLNINFKCSNPKIFDPCTRPHCAWKSAEWCDL